MVALQSPLGALRDCASVSGFRSAEESTLYGTSTRANPQHFIPQRSGDAMMRGKLTRVASFVKDQLYGTLPESNGGLGFRVSGENWTLNHFLSVGGLQKSSFFGVPSLASQEALSSAASLDRVQGSSTRERRQGLRVLAAERVGGSKGGRVGFKDEGLDSRQGKRSHKSRQQSQSTDRPGSEPRGSRAARQGPVPEDKYAASGFRDRSSAAQRRVSYSGADGGPEGSPRLSQTRSTQGGPSQTRSTQGGPIQTRSTEPRPNQAPIRPDLTGHVSTRLNESRSSDEGQRPYPTAVPRPPHLQDGEWTQADANTVKKALNDATHLAPKFSAAPKDGQGSSVLVGRSLEELEQLAVELGEQKYRGKQLHQYIYKNKCTEMKDLLQLPQKMREGMEERGFSVGRIPVHHVAAAADGTAKILLRLEDNRLVEAVGIPMEMERGVHKLTACVSSQVGCPLRCTFCATGKGGFARNLRPHEIVGQVLALEELFKHRVNNVVFMGMGEPLLNLPSVLAAHRCLNKDLGIGQRMITISTVGVPNTIQRLATHKLQSTLAVSLHAPSQELRERLVPSARAYPLEALLEDCRAYFDTTGRRVSFEYTLLAGVNDQPAQANELADLLHRWRSGSHVNLIPYNPVADSDYRRPNKAHVMAFADALKNRKVTVTIRQTRGMEANAACGQLRNEFQKVPLTSTVG